MHFNYPASLALLFTLPFWGGFIIWRERLRRRRLLQLGDQQLINALTNVNSRSRLWKQICWLTALTCIILALARPVWGETLTLIEQEGISVFIVLDVSNSMNAQDITPSRLERAKLIAIELASQLNGNQIGLILFAGSAFVQFPLTTDTTSAITFLTAVSSQSISNQGTALESALDLAISSFNPQQTADRMIILMTDGESHDDQPLRAAERAREQNITVYTIGFGSTSGEPIPITDSSGTITGFRTDEAGNPLLSQMDEETLIAIAQRTGGTYQPSNTNEVKKILDQLEESHNGSLGNRIESKPIERFGIFVALAIAALSVDMLLSEARKDA